MHKTTVQAWNFRVLEHLRWSPSGVCLLAGPNGSGKTTTLDALYFLRTLFERGHEAALIAVDGRYVRRSDCPENEPVTFQINVEDICWKLRFPMSSNGIKGTYGEELSRGKDIVLRAAMFDEGFYLGKERRLLDETRCCAKWLWDRDDNGWMKPLVDVLQNISIYKPYSLHLVRAYAPTELRATPRLSLSTSGQNLWDVLANWKGSRKRYPWQFDWVMSQARKAFPGIISTMELEGGFPILYPPDATSADQGLPPSRAADGLLVGLLHLTAIADAKPGSIIAIDEVENQLHPHAIRSLIAAMREQAEARDLTIVFTTHSPVVLNAFRDEPEQVYVMERANDGDSTPVAMTEIHSEEWLAQAKLGTLYERLAFGAPILRKEPP